ncbi:MAG: ribosomal protein S18-alanine N-acetyltransferase [bacterium]
MTDIDVKETLERNAFYEISEILIRNMQLRDLDQVCKLERSIFAHPWSRKSITYEILDNPFSYALMAEMENKLIGCAIGWCIDTEAHIGTFAVDVNFRRKGIGGLLLGSLITDFKHKRVRRVYLEVRRSNIAAQSLYLKYGFKFCGERKNYYSKENEDALLMSLSLKEG